MLRQGRHDNQHRVLQIKMTGRRYSTTSQQCRCGLEKEAFDIIYLKLIATSSEKYVRFLLQQISR